jgi:heat shock protein HspQ
MNQWRQILSNRQMRGCRQMRMAKFQIGQIVRHRFFPFRGVIFDVDPVFSNTEEWWQAIPEAIRPRKDQPFYHLLAENDETAYVAYVSEQNLVVDESGTAVRHPQVDEFFNGFENGCYVLRQSHPN